MGGAKPVLGYPSKYAAVVAMVLNGDDVDTIADRLGVKKQEIHVSINHARRAGKLPAKDEAADTRGIWTTEKLAKARRLFGQTMIYIAEAIQVPADELLTYALNGVLPPMGERQRTAQLLDALAKGEEPPAPEPEAVQPLQLAPPEPSRDDDEAELAALEDEEEDDDEHIESREPDAGSRAGRDGDEGRDRVPVAGAEPVAVSETGADVPAEAATAALAEPIRNEGGEAPAAEPDRSAKPAHQPAPAPSVNSAHHLYNLIDAQGRFLDESLEGATKMRKWAWKGTTKHMAKVFERNPDLKDAYNPQRVTA